MANQTTKRASGVRAKKKEATKKTAQDNKRTVRVKVDPEVGSSRSSLSEKEKQARMQKKFATLTSGIGMNRTAFDTGSVAQSSQGNFYSPQLSTDFLEKPQNLRERRAWYRHFYHSNEYVGNAIDLHSSIPLSKVRLTKPKAENPELAEYSYGFFSDMCERLQLFKSLIEISHEYWLMGNSFIFAEEHDPYAVDESDPSSKANAEELKQLGEQRSKMLFKKFGIVDKDPNYMGWDRLIILPPDQVRLEKVPFADHPKIEYIPDSRTQEMIIDNQAGISNEGSSSARLPHSIVESVNEGGAIPLDTDPYSGSYCFHLARKKSQYETMGVSILERCVNTLLYWDKIRQAQTSIASRHMTPIRVVWAEELSDFDVEELRGQVDMALTDPDFSIIANYQINWEEMGSNGRLLEVSTEYQIVQDALFAGLGVTREVLTGEGVYSGSRITLEILNTHYMLFRELLQDYVEEHLFKPVAIKKGFVEVDKYGRKKVIYPKLSFTRLAIRDNDSYFDQVFQLYNKGSVSIDVILDMLNIDPDSTKKKIESDMFGVNDAAFQDLMRSLYGAVGNQLLTDSNAMSVIAQKMGLTVKGADEGDAGEDAGGFGGGARFASDLESSDKVDQITRKLAMVLKDNPGKINEISKKLGLGD